MGACRGACREAFHLHHLPLPATPQCRRPVEAGPSCLRRASWEARPRATEAYRVGACRACLPSSGAVALGPWVPTEAARQGRLAAPTLAAAWPKPSRGSQPLRRSPPSRPTRRGARQWSACPHAGCSSKSQACQDDGPASPQGCAHPRRCPAHRLPWHPRSPA